MNIHQLPTAVDKGEGGSIKSTPSVASKEKEASDRLAVFMGLLFASAVFDANGSVVNYKPAELSDNVKEVFESVTSTTDQARMIGENLTDFSVEVADEKEYLPRCTRYPFLPLTLLTYLMHINLHLIPQTYSKKQWKTKYPISKRYLSIWTTSSLLETLHSKYL